MKRVWTLRKIFYFIWSWNSWKYDIYRYQEFEIQQTDIFTTSLQIVYKKITLIYLHGQTPYDFQILFRFKNKNNFFSFTTISYLYFYKWSPGRVGYSQALWIEIILIDSRIKTMFSLINLRTLMSLTSLNNQPSKLIHWCIRTPLFMYMNYLNLISLILKEHFN